MIQTVGGVLTAQAPFVYDVLGNRIETDEYTQSAGVTTITRNAYDGKNAWVDLSSTNTLEMRRVYLDGQDQMLARVNSSGNLAWYYTDHLGSVRVLTNAAGTTFLDQIAYDAYGNITSESTAAKRDEYKYDGYRWDTVVALYQTGVRMYNPATEQWLSEDSMQFKVGDSNLYRYAGNSPTNHTDPSGLEIINYDVLHQKILEQLRREMRYGLGVWDAFSFYVIGLGGKVWSSPRSLLDIFVPDLTEDAKNYQTGCIGLVRLRVGSKPYDPNAKLFTNLQDALDEVKAVGASARIFAIQFNGSSARYNVVSQTKRCGKIVTFQGLPWATDGNHATWLQIRPGLGFWESLGLDGWSGTNFTQGARQRKVKHQLLLPHYDHTLYGVVAAKPTEFPAPANGSLSPTEVPQKMHKIYLKDSRIDIACLMFGVSASIGLIWIVYEARVDWIAKITEGDNASQREAIQHFIAYPDSKAIPKLLTCLHNPNLRIRESAIIALYRLGPRAVAALSECAHGDDPTIRASAIRALGSPVPWGYYEREFRPEDDERVFPLVMAATQGECGDVRAAAVESIFAVGYGARRTKVALDYLLKALEDPEAKVRQKAAHSIGMFAALNPDVERLDATVRPLARLAFDPSPEVCQAALVALRRLGPRSKNAIPNLIDCLKVKNYP